MNEIIVIMGPSGAGKTTLANNLVLHNDIVIPRHCTTRARRGDDVEGFYRFLTHEDFEKKLLNNEFFIESGDGPYISKIFGNFYGVLNDDCLKGFELSNKIILLLSYKDLERLNYLRNNGYQISIINLTFTDIKAGVRERIANDKLRNHTETDIVSRIKCALSDTALFYDKLNAYADLTLYTDKLDIDETYNEVCKKLMLTHK